MPRPTNAVRIDNVAGVPLYYERNAAGDAWGDLAEDEKYGVWVTLSFRARINRAFHTLPGDKPTGIITAGGWVEKPGAHGLARAFDLDGIIWPGNRIFKASNYSTLSEKKLYYGIQCHMMQYFGNVLGYEYNVAHRDHLHLDDLIEPILRLNSKAVVTGIQGALRFVWGETGMVNGVWSEVTTQDARQVRPYSGQYPDQEWYLDFLQATARKAFSSPYDLAPLTDHGRIEELERKYVLLEERVTNIESR